MPRVHIADITAEHGAAKRFGAADNAAAGGADADHADGLFIQRAARNFIPDTIFHLPVHPRQTAREGKDIAEC